MPGQFSRTSAIVIIDTLLVVFALPISLAIRNPQDVPMGGGMDLATAIIISSMSALLCQLFVSTYRHAWSLIGITDVIALMQYSFIVVVTFTLAGFLLFRLDDIARSIPFIYFGVILVSLTGARLIYRSGKKQLHIRQTSHKEAVLLLGAGDGALLVAELLSSRAAPHVEIVGIIDDQMAQGRTIAGYPIIGNLQSFLSVLSRLDVQDMPVKAIVLAKPETAFERERLQSIKDQASRRGIPVYSFLKLSHLIQSGQDLKFHTIYTKRDVYKTTKRLIDAFLALTLILLTLPAWIIIAASIRFCIGSPIIFVQRRLGLRSTSFKLRKFRTMKDPYDPHGRLLCDEERTPWLGRLLRRTRLDELPQLWNIFVGDMALIGPRPLLRRDLNGPEKLTQLRSEVRPGITGWAQVNGGHALNTEDKFALDAYYIKNQSIALDMIIITRTIQMILCGERVNEEAVKRAHLSLSLA